ncbi:SDR family oxidoreductase [Candidatus Phycosocius spiralis]|uniref:Uncharacterized protein n=1 Tax=Candidatus Phycosocius spiralis TaxID=2815099 RepID=A0ABQ4PX60_9PROT|nr:SDR family NAD(P)-dependent oxidoreductase [Candidatus Phycosocius spiralis]GIU67646.1 hypothetical protein PsB1_1800 [Candidatus Phycosocius spiralis]
MKLYNYSGKTALVTGGGGKFGNALCLALAQGGSKVIVSDFDLTKARATAAKVGGLALGLDVSDAAMWTNALASIQELFGPLDLLFHCASPNPRDHLDSATLLATCVGGVALGMHACTSDLKLKLGAYAHVTSVQFVSDEAWSPKPEAAIWSACQFAKRGLHLAQSSRKDGLKSVLVGYNIPPKPGKMVRDEEVIAATLWGISRGKCDLFVPGGIGVGAFRRKSL